MFHCERFRLLIASIESTIDPFDITLLAAPIAKNARIAAQRYSESDSSKLRPTLSAANMQMRKKALLNQASSTSDGVRNTPSFSSFYKLSTSWFGN
ncbi:unnamed protein product [Anisakis simplex]|uniref:Uncharacterized protein n=1 Tax=Anisakis simplex TaxID=6269 RepID=A0A0M3KHQ6_ANISI|nr:unnamed protein product [Anisakis simplex]